MIENGSCDLACNNSDCNYDGTDCACLSDDCSNSRLYSPACNYGKGTKCEVQSIQSRMLQMYSFDFESVFDVADCPCDIKDLADLNTCNEQCNTDACLYSFGSCELNCFSKCSKCYGAIADESKCLACQPGYMQLFAYCLDECPRGFEPHSVSTDLCVQTIYTAFEEIYVSADSSEVGVGTAESPYNSLYIAVNTLHAFETTIWLLKGEHAYVSSTNFLVNVYSRQKSSFTPIKLKIAGLMCETSTHPSCADVSPTIIFNNDMLTLSSIDLTFEDLTITQTTDLSSCHTMCSYCPKVEFIKDKIYDDRGEEINGIPQFCDPGTSFTMIVLRDGQTVFKVKLKQNVDFANIRYQPLSVLEVYDGSLSLINVNFLRVQTSKSSGTKNNAYVILNCSNVSYCFFSYKGGSLSYANDGYEFSLKQSFASCFLIYNARTVTFQDIVFSFNVLGSNSTDKSMIFIENPLFITIQNCRFEYILSLGSLIYVKLKSAVLYSNEIALDHFIFKGLSFLNSSMFSSAFIGIHYIACESQHNILISDIDIRESIVISSSFIQINYPDYYSNESSSDDEYFFGDIQLTNVRLIRCYTSGMLINTNLIKHLAFNNLWVQDSGSGKESPDAFTVKYFIDNPKHYIKRKNNKEFNYCTSSMILLKFTNSVKLTDVHFQGNICQNVAGLVADSMTITAVSVTFLSNTSEANSVGMLNLEAQKCSLKDAVFNNNQIKHVNSNLLSLKCSSILLEGIKTQENFASGTILNLEFDDAVVSNVNCISNSSNLSSCIVAQTNLGNSRFSLSHSKFEQNLSTNASGAVLIRSITNLNNMLLLEIEDCSFNANTAEIGGGALQIIDSINLAASSYIRDSRFVGNVAKSYGTVIAGFKEGSLLFDRCNFESNTGQRGSAISLYATCADPSCYRLMINHSTFITNIGEAVIYVDSIYATPELVTDSLLIKGNSGRGFDFMSSKWRDTNSVLTDNGSELGSGAGLSIFSEAVLHGTVFSHNKKALAAGALHITSGAILECHYCKFNDNTVKYTGGALYVDKLSRISLFNCVFTRNTSDMASAIFMNFPSNSTLHNCSFIENHSNTSHLIQLQSTNLTISDSVIESNTGGLSSDIEIISSNLELINCRFRNITSDISGFILASSISSVYMLNTSMTEAKGTMALGVIGASGTCSLTIEKSELSYFEVKNWAIYVDIMR